MLTLILAGAWLAVVLFIVYAIAGSIVSGRHGAAVSEEES